MPDLFRLIEIVLRHPIPIPLVHFPIALSYFAALLAALALVSYWRKATVRSEFFSQALFYDLGLLAVIVLPAMATGILENQTRYNGLAPNTSLKITFGVTLLVLAAALTWWRCRTALLTRLELRFAMIPVAQ